MANGVLTVDVPAQRANWIALAALVLTIVGGLVIGLRSYTDDAGAATSRLTAVETRQTESDKRMERIERTIERLEGKIDQLLRERP